MLGLRNCQKAKELTPGECFGIHERFGSLEEKNSGLYLVSFGCEIISYKVEISSCQIYMIYLEKN